MEIRRLRESLGLNQSEFASLLDLNSKGHVSEIERTGACSVQVALKLERLSGGKIDAASLNPRVALVRADGKAA